MKKNLILIFVMLVLSCKEDEDNTPTAPINDPFDPMVVQAVLLKQGTFIGVGHSVSGTVKIYNDAGQHMVVLDPFSTQNGPDLKLYLSKDQNATEYINLGSLKSTTGKQSYAVMGTTDFDNYKFVLVWCQEFSVLFGSAEVK